MVDDQCATRRQSHFTTKRRFNLRFNLISVEQRYIVGVQFQLALILWHVHANKFSRLIKRCLLIGNDFSNVAAEIVAQSANDNVAFLINQKRGRARFSRLLYCFPDSRLIIQIPLQLFCGSANTSCAHNGAHAIGHKHVGHCRFEFVTVVAFNAA